VVLFAYAALALVYDVSAQHSSLGAVELLARFAAAFVISFEACTETPRIRAIGIDLRFPGQKMYFRFDWRRRRTGKSEIFSVSG